MVDYGETGDEKESLLVKELERLSRQDLIERIIRMKEVRNEFANLPDEIVLSIFNYLPRATLGKTACVSKRWRRISYDPIFWKKVNINWNAITRGTFKSGTLSHVLSRGCQHLYIDSWGEMERPIFTDQRPKESYLLKELIIYSQLSSNELISILSRCPELVSIRAYFVVFNDDVCKQIARCPNVREVVINEVPECVSCAGYLSMFTGCRSLETFRPYFLANVPDSKYPSAKFSAEEARSLIEALPPTMKEIALFKHCLSLTDKDVERLVAKVPNVANLNFSDCPLLTAKSVDSLRQLSQLCNLHIDNCHGIPYTALCGLLEFSKSLRTLSIRGLATKTQLNSLRAKFRDVHFNCKW